LQRAAKSSSVGETVDDVGGGFRDGIAEQPAAPSVSHRAPARKRA
jgi:hypothetical protein